MTFDASASYFSALETAADCCSFATGVVVSEGIFRMEMAPDLNVGCFEMGSHSAKDCH